MRGVLVLVLVLLLRGERRQRRERVGLVDGGLLLLLLVLVLGVLGLLWLMRWLWLGGRRGVLRTVVATGVGVCVYPGMTGQFVAPRELLGTAGEGARMGLLAGVGADVSGLMLQSMERLLADRTFIGPRQLVLHLAAVHDVTVPIR